ncbi:MAG: Fe-S cluster assembly protein SufD [Acidobacteria bacterium]|nr:Fe-S cluster assembly protein SufD [Acidobacteriota bacterium]
MKDASKAALAHLGRYASIEANPFVALNTANLTDVFVVEIEDGAVVTEPVRIAFHTDGAAAVHPRVLILAGRNSQASVIEEYSGSGRYFTNAVTEIVAAENATLDHYKLQQESPEAYHVGTVQMHQGRNTNVTTFSLSFGGALVRNDINGVLDDENGECTMNGLFLTGDQQHVDHHTMLDHAKPHCRSREYYRGILGGSSTGVFNGKIIVRQDAQKTDAIQSNKNLLLSKDATINTKPQLEIWADDVRCTHGATVGQLDEEARFYLRSRGIGEAAARVMLTHAFAQDVLERIKIEALRTRMEGLIV